MMNLSIVAKNTSSIRDAIAKLPDVKADQLQRAHQVDWHRAVAEDMMRYAEQLEIELLNDLEKTFSEEQIDRVIESV